MFFFAERVYQKIKSILSKGGVTDKFCAIFANNHLLMFADGNLPMFADHKCGSFFGEMLDNSLFSGKILDDSPFSSKLLDDS